MMAETDMASSKPAGADEPEARQSFLHHREAEYAGERVALTPEQERARKRRGQWMALALFVFCILVFLITMTKMGVGMPTGGP